MLWFRLVAAAAALASAPAAAEDIPPITLLPGEAVTIHFDDGGRVGAPERGRAEWSRFDVFAARQLSGMTPPDAPVPDATPLTAPDGVTAEPIPPGQVRLRLMSIADRHTLLVVENGEGRALRYRARMTLKGRTTPTDVCIVLPRLPSYEHWPDRLEKVELSSFEFISWPPGANPTCE